MKQVDRAGELTDLLLGSDWLREVLALVAERELPDCWVGAGAVRDLVWDTRFGNGFDAANIADVDVVFFDPDDLGAEQEQEIERVLHEQRAEIDWDVKNQARVHLWYEARFGRPAPPLTSTIDGISTWPETATAVAVRLAADGTLEIAAPLGVDDLLDGVWRSNVARVSDAEIRARIERKQPAQRWPGVVVIE